MGLSEVIDSKKRFVLHYKPLLYSRGYDILGSVSRVGLCDLNAEKNREDYCIVAHICPMNSTPKLKPVFAMRILESIVQNTFEDYNVYIRYNDKK